MRIQLEHRLDHIVIAWILLCGIACAARIAFTPLNAPLGVDVFLPYVLLVFAPAASLLLALRWFKDSDDQREPSAAVLKIGRWRTIERSEARRHELFGSRGIMVSLLIGILLNVPVRALEYLGSMPALSGPLPDWLSVLHTMMTLDVVLMTSLYSIAFVAALRHVSFFPRLLVAVWCLDLTFQLVTAEMVARTASLPPVVAHALHTLLDGNVKKVLISMALWLPYLLLSRRVNVTYRSRVAA